jgi:hypothetical protein
VLALQSNAGPDGWHRINGLRIDGDLVVRRGTRLLVEDSAIRAVRFAANYDQARFIARRSIFEELRFAPTTPPADARIELEYVTVTGPARASTLLASDCLFVDLVLSGDGSGEKSGCIRYSRVQAGFDRTPVHTFRSTAGPARFVVVPCLAEDPSLPGSPLIARPARFGEPGYGVLADDSGPAVAGGAENGGEVGAYNARAYLARLAAAVEKARGHAPPGRRVFAYYDRRLLAPLPE